MGVLVGAVVEGLIELAGERKIPSSAEGHLSILAFAKSVEPDSRPPGYQGAALGKFEIPAPLLEQEEWREAPEW